MLRTRLGFLVAVLVLALVAMACGGGGGTDEPDAGVEPTPAAEETVPTATEGAEPAATEPAAGDTATEAATAAGGEDLPVIRLQGLSGGMSSMFLRTIEAEGLDVANGFQGEFLYTDAGASLQTFLQGESDVTFDIEPAGAAIANNAGNPVRVFHNYLNNHAAIITRTDTDFESPEDLIGQRVGHFGVDSGTTTTFSVILERQFGFDILEEYEFAEAAPAALVELLAAGEVDAIFDFTPHTERSLVEGDGRLLFAAADAEGFVPGLGYIGAMEDWLQENEELARAVVQAARDAYAMWNDSGYELFREEPYYSLLDVSDDVVDRIIERAANEYPLYTESWDDETAAEAQEYVEQMAAAGRLLEEEPEPGFVTTLDTFYSQ